MPVNTKHPQYKKYEYQWKKIRVCMDGEDEVKKASEAFLPRLQDQTLTDYQAYRDRAMFLNATARTVVGLTGAVMRKTPILENVTGYEDELKVVGRGGESIHELISTAVEEDLAVGRAGYLIDAPDSPNGEPYISTYFAENIINWDTEINADTGEIVLTMVVLHEVITEEGDDPFKKKDVNYYRVLLLVDGVYKQQLYRETPDEEKAGNSSDPRDNFELRGEFEPKMFGGRPVNFIPFVFLNPMDLLTKVSKPPTIDLVNVNLSHYKNSADLEHGRHLTALPTPWAAGFDPKGSTLRLGSGVAWIADNENAKFGMLEFTGQGLGHLASGMTDKEKLMAALGARLLEEQTAGVEAAEAIRLRQSGESASLANIANQVSKCFTRLLNWWEMWRSPSAQGDIRVILNSDFNLMGLDPNTMVALMSALQAGQISWSTWFYNLQRGEMIPDGTTMEDEAALIAEGPPSGIPVLEETEETSEEPVTVDE